MLIEEKLTKQELFTTTEKRIAELYSEEYRSRSIHDD